MLFFLTLIHLEVKVISLCHQHRARPSCTSMHSNQFLYCWLINFLIKISLKMIMDRSKNGRWIIPFQKFSRLRVKKKTHQQKQPFVQHFFPRCLHDLSLPRAVALTLLPPLYLKYQINSLRNLVIMQGPHYLTFWAKIRPQSPSQNVFSPYFKKNSLKKLKTKLIILSLLLQAINQASCFSIFQGALVWPFFTEYGYYFPP